MAKPKHSPLFGSAFEGALFSPCRTWRYRLWRVWDDRLPKMLVIMLNPSTADEHVLDPTCAKIIKFAKQWGYGRIDVCNLFAYRSTDPSNLPKAADPVGPDNDKTIQKALKEADFVLCAWGNHGSRWGRSAEVVRMVEKAGKRMYAIGFNDGGEPVHPLYQPLASKPIPMLKHPGLLQMDIEDPKPPRPIRPRKRPRLETTPKNNSQVITS